MLLATSKKGLCMRCFHKGCWGCSQTIVASIVVPALLTVAAPSARGAKRLLPNDMPESSAWSCRLLPETASSKGVMLPMQNTQACAVTPAGSIAIICLRHMRRGLAVYLH